MTWWGWLLTGTGIGIAWTGGGLIAASMLGARLARINEQEGLDQ